LSVLVCFFVLIGFYYFVFFDRNDFEKALIEKIQKDSESLIDGDEKNYRNTLNSGQQQGRHPVDASANKKDASSGEKKNFRAPEYEKKDKDYLNKIIQSR
jgi:hypothetical protein